MKEKRKFERRSASLEMVVKVSNDEIMQLITQDISDGGLFVLAGSNPILPIGTEVTIMPTRPLKDGSRPVMRARVVRQTNQGMGIEFLHPKFT